MVFPNPATDRVTVLVNHPLAQRSKWVLYDQLGRVVREIELETQVKEYAVDLEGLPSGIFYYTVLTAGKKRIQQGKIVLMR